jgi:hypothetical protein
VSEVETKVSAAMVEFLRWIAAKHRSYTDAMEVWQTSCPRLSVWEDASIAGYVFLRAGAEEFVVVLTPSGQAIVDAA